MTVVLLNGPAQWHEEATRYAVEPHGLLTLYTRSGGFVAAYAAGQWTCVKPGKTR